MGGLWLEATIYCAEPLQESIFQRPLFTCKSQPIETGYISKYRWTSFCFGGHQNGILFRFMHDAFELYWEKNDAAIDYLLVDYLIECAYSQIPAVKAQIDDVPYNNVHRDDLQAAMNAALPAGSWNEVIKKETTLYKLSWRERYSRETKDGQRSIFDHFLNNCEENL